MQVKRFIVGLMLAAGMLSTGCGGTEVSIDEPTDLASREDALPYCGDGTPCSEGWTCVNNTCHRTCAEPGTTSTCGTGWKCCLGYPDSYTPYCESTYSPCRIGPEIEL